MIRAGSLRLCVRRRFQSLLDGQLQQHSFSSCSSLRPPLSSSSSSPATSSHQPPQNCTLNLKTANHVIVRNFSAAKTPLEFDEDGNPIDYQLRSVQVDNNRVDTLLRALTRLDQAKIEEGLLSGFIRVNGQRVKKSQGVNEADEIDVIVRQSPDNPQLAVCDQYELDELHVDDDDDAIDVQVRVRRNILLPDYADQFELRK